MWAAHQRRRPLQEKTVTPKRSSALDLAVDLEGGVVPISKAASSLAALLKRARDRRQPIIVTQKGYPTGVILDVKLYTALRALAEEAETGSEPQGEQTEPVPPPAELQVAPTAIAEPLPTRRGGRRRKMQGDA
jgi:prevent-host-death family protein